MKKQKKNTAKTDKTVLALGIALAVAVVVMIVALAMPKSAPRGDFVKPDFDSAAVQGVPDVPENLGYSSPYQEGMAYRFSVCGNVTLEGKTATVYFTNAEDNEVYLKLRVLDESGNILGETGLIKPGEYVKSVELNKTLAVGTKIKLKIMSYEPDTYLSAGSAALNTQIGGASE